MRKEDLWFLIVILVIAGALAGILLMATQGVSLFGPLIALVGLGAVAFLIIRKH